jgi:hypothetical protein
MTEPEILAAIDETRATMRDRVWLLREHTAAEIWTAARHVLELRHLIVERDGSWQWKADDTLLRDYYANALRPYDDIAERGWPERRAV